MNYYRKFNFIKYKSSVGHSAFSGDVTNDKKAKKNISNYERLVVDCVKQLKRCSKKKIIVYCNTKEQLNDIISRVDFDVDYNYIDDWGYEIWRVKS